MPAEQLVLSLNTYIFYKVTQTKWRGSTSQYLQWHLIQDNLLVDCVIVRLRSLSEIIIYRINSVIKKKRSIGIKRSQG